MPPKITIGILALQGAFAEHRDMVQLLGANTIEIRDASDLHKPLDGLILPGGESTAQGKLLQELNLLIPLKKSIQEGLPVFGTCAGLTLLANQIEGENHIYFNLMDITVKRNAYGRQLGSFYTEGVFDQQKNIPMSFIRAPYITKVGNDVKILSVVNSHIVAARQNNMLVTSFHPEITKDTNVHRYFLSFIR